MAVRLEATLFWYRPHRFYCANQVVLMLTSCQQRGLYQSKVTSSLACIYGQVTKHTTVKWPIVRLHTGSGRVLIIRLHVLRLWISLLIEFSSKTDNRNITAKNESGTFVLSPLTSFIVVIIIVSKRVTLSWRKTDFGQSIWPAGDQLTTVFTVLNCLKHEFLKSFLVQGRQQSFWKFSILSYILDLQWCLPDKRKIHSQLSAVASSVARPRKCYINRLQRFI